MDMKKITLNFILNEEPVSLEIDENARLLDVIRDVSQAFPLPCAAYSVSGEYAMIKAAAAAGLIDEAAVACEAALSVYRAGADILITYYAKELAGWMDEGRIG